MQRNAPRRLPKHLPATALRVDSTWGSHSQPLQPGAAATVSCDEARPRLSMHVARQPLALALDDRRRVMCGGEVRWKAHRDQLGQCQGWLGNGTAGLNCWCPCIATAFQLQTSSGGEEAPSVSLWTCDVMKAEVNTIFRPRRALQNCPLAAAVQGRASDAPTAASQVTDLRSEDVFCAPKHASFLPAYVSSPGFARTARTRVKAGRGVGMLWRNLTAARHEPCSLRAGIKEWLSSKTAPEPLNRQQPLAIALQTAHVASGRRC